MEWLDRLLRTRAKILLEPRLGKIPDPPDAVLEGKIRALGESCRKRGCQRPIHRLGFGRIPFSPPPPVVEALAVGARRASVAGGAALEDLRDAAAAFHRRVHGQECGAAQLTVASGGAQLVTALLAVCQGPLLVPTPSREGCLPPSKLLGKRVVPVRTRREDGYRLRPDLLESRLAHIHEDQKLLLLGQPHDASGSLYTRQELEDLARVCRKHGVIVVSDERGAWSAFDSGSFSSMGAAYPDGTVVIDGPPWASVAIGLFPRGTRELIGDVVKIAASVYSPVPAPLQQAALAYYAGGETVESHVEDCRAINAIVGRRTSVELARVAGLDVSTPQIGFHLILDFSDATRELNVVGLDTSAALCDDILRAEHAAILSGESLMLAADDLVARCAFTDYDGDAALERWRSGPPMDADEEDGFVRAACPRVVQGVGALAHYLRRIVEGIRPEHP